MSIEKEIARRLLSLLRNVPGWGCEAHERWELEQMQEVDRQEALELEPETRQRR